MDGLSFLPGAASTPIRGLIWLAEVIQEQAEQERDDQAQTARRALEDTEAARVAGEISDDEARRREASILEQIVEAPTAGEVAQKSSNKDSR